MKVRITRNPTGLVDGIPMRHYRTGETYDIPAMLAEYLVAEGFAAIEMRQGQRRTRFRSHDRRSTRPHA